MQKDLAKETNSFARYITHEIVAVVVVVVIVVVVLPFTELPNSLMKITKKTSAFYTVSIYFANSYGISA